MKKNLFMMFITLCFMFVPSFVSAETVNNFRLDTWQHKFIDTTPKKVGAIKIVDGYEIGEYSDTIEWKSSDVSVATVTSDGTITPIGDGVCVITATVGDEVEEVTITVTAFNTLIPSLNAILDTVPNSINLDVVENMKLKRFPEGYDYISDYIYNYLYENYSTDDIEISIENFENNSVNVKSSKGFWNLGHYFEPVYSSNQKLVTVNYAAGNEEDKRTVETALDKVKENYNVYINDFISDGEFSDELIFNNSSIQKDLGSDIMIKSDFRMGDDEPGKAVRGGMLVLGKNNVYYGAIDKVVFYQVLETPTLSGNKVEALKEFVEKHLLKDNQTVIVEKTDDTFDDKIIYKITIKEKSSNSLVSMLLSPFVMKVKADSSYTVYTTIDENANYVYDTTTNNTIENSPKTGDLGLVYISLLLISSVGVVVLSKKARI